MQLIGVPAGQFCVVNNGILFDVLQSSGLAHAAAILHVPENRNHLFAGLVGAIENRALGFDETFTAGFAAQQAGLLELADAIAHHQIAAAATAKRNTFAVLAAEKTQIFRSIYRLLMVLHDLIPEEPRNLLGSINRGEG
jgi:hypothetical protein